MKRKRTLSGIRGALDCKNLNVFGEIIGNFQGRHVPTVDDFKSYLQSYDHCDNLKKLNSRNSTNEKSTDPPKRNRRSKKAAADDELPNEESTNNAAPDKQVIVHQHAIVKSINDFFKKFCEKFPPETPQYERFIKLVRAHEGKNVDTSVFYSTMKDILVGEEDKVLLDEFVSLIRPEDSLDAHSFEEPGIKEDFPFNVDRKKAKFAENCTSQQVLPLHQMQQQTQAAITTMMPTSVLSCNQVTDAVNSAVESKVKDFLVEAKSSMDPHTYVSFLDIMVELRTLYKANAIEEALEKLDIAKGILSRVNPRLRVELDRYFPIVNANGAKHNLEHHTFEQSQRQYRDWQQAQVARKTQHLLLEGCTNNGDGEKNATGEKHWWSDIKITRPDNAQQRRDRLKVSAHEKEQIQNARKVAKENALSRSANARSGVDSNKKEDLLDALGSGAKSVKRKVTIPLSSKTTVQKNISTKTVAKTGTVASGNSKATPRQKGPKLNVRNISKPVKKNTVISSNLLKDKPQLTITQSSKNQTQANTVTDSNAYMHGDQQKNFADYLQLMQYQQHLHPMSSFSHPLPPPPRIGGNERRADNSQDGNNVNPNGNDDQNQHQHPYSSSRPVLPPPPSMMHPFHMSPSQSSSTMHAASTANDAPAAMGSSQFSTYGPQVTPGMMQQPSQQQYHHHHQQQQQFHQHQFQQQQQQFQQHQHHQHLHQHHNQLNYTPAFQTAAYGGFGSSMFPHHLSQTQGGAMILPPPPSSVRSTVQGDSLQTHSAVSSSMHSDVTGNNSTFPSRGSSIDSPSSSLQQRKASSPNATMSSPLTMSQAAMRPHQSEINCQSSINVVDTNNKNADGHVNVEQGNRPAALPDENGA